jgi:hypothetical protein
MRSKTFGRASDAVIGSPVIVRAATFIGHFYNGRVLSLPLLFPRHKTVARLQRYDACRLSQCLFAPHGLVMPQAAVHYGKNLPAVQGRRWGVAS